MSIKLIQSQPSFVIFTSSQNWTVPFGVFKVKVIAIGGGGGGGGGYSTTYTGGNGAAGATLYAEMLVAPGTELGINIGAGGTGGTGGSSPTAGGGGGSTEITFGGNLVLFVSGGGGGGAATASANGSNAGAPSLGNQYTGFQGSSPPVFPLFLFQTSISGVNAVLLNPTINGQGSTYGNPFGQSGLSYGSGGFGGGVNQNGTNGISGIVVIWWGD